MGNKKPQPPKTLKNPKTGVKVIGRRGYSEVYLLPVKELKVINPYSYFVSTGDALTKMNVLIDDVKDLLTSLEHLRSQLVGIKGINKWLETEVTDSGDKIVWPEDLMLMNDIKWPPDYKEYKEKYSQGAITFKVKNPKVKVEDSQEVQKEENS